MIEQYISFETAKLAKEKGFNHTVYGMYRGQDTYWSNDGTKCVCGFDEELDDWEDEVERIYKWLTPRPTQFLLQKWLREEYNIHISIFYDHYSKTFEYDVCEKLGESWNIEAGKTYEEALENGLIVALKLIKSDKEINKAFEI